MRLKRGFIKSHFLQTTEEIQRNRFKAINLRVKIDDLKRKLVKAGITGYGELFNQFQLGIAVHHNPTADYEKNRNWINLPSEECVHKLNQLWELANNDLRINSSLQKQAQNILGELVEPPF